MTTIQYSSQKDLTETNWNIVSVAKDYVLGDAPLHFEYDPEGSFAFGLEADAATRTLGRYELSNYVNPQAFVAYALGKHLGVQMHEFSDKTLFLDTETHDADQRWNNKPQEHFRLGQYAWGEGDVVLTEDYDEIIDVCRQADMIVGHNHIAYDLSYLLGDESLYLPVLDTMVYASLAVPAPPLTTMRDGKTYKTDKPESMMRFFGLDNLAFTFGIEGKIGDLQGMAKEFGGFGLIPTDHPEFRAYAEQDVIVGRELARALLYVEPPTDYHWREQEIWQVNAQITRNGFRLDVDAARRRVEELRQRKEELLSHLAEEYDMPTEGKMPWLTNAGKDAIKKILADNGISEDQLPRTKTGNPSLGGEALISVTEGTPAEDLGRSLAEMMGQRSLAEQALNCVQDDGFCHPEITTFQRSGRTSVTKPALTVWTSRGTGSVEKSYFVPDSEDHVLLEVDYSAADARVVAAYSGDVEYAKRFEPGAPSTHEINGRVVFGDELYDSDPDKYRQIAKALGHAYAYGAQANTLMKTSGQPREVAERFIYRMDMAYPDVTRWRAEATKAAGSGWIVNDWGRVMPIERGREFTQAPALLGQSGTREIMYDALMKLRDEGLLKFVKCPVHDAIAFSFPEHNAVETRGRIIACMETEFRGIEFTVDHGEFAKNWMEAGH